VAVFELSNNKIMAMTLRRLWTDPRLLWLVVCVQRLAVG